MYLNVDNTAKCTIESFAFDNFLLEKSLINIFLGIDAKPSSTVFNKCYRRM